MKRSSFFLGTVILLVIVAIGIAAVQFTQASAQEEGQGQWLSSAEAPAGTPLERYSPPDVPTANLVEEDPEIPDQLISWRVTGSALKPRENDVSYSVGGGGACTYVTGGDASTVWNIPVNLPQGAVVDTLRVYYYDTSGSNFSAWFTVYDLYGDIVQEWNVSSDGNFGNSFSDSAQINHTIDYSVYNYLLNWRPVASGSSLQLCGFRLFYDPPPFGLEFLPVIRNE